MWYAINETLSEFCSSPFWDTNLTWNSPDPDFTSCFEKTILAWLPCLFLWSFLPLEIYFLRQRTSAFSIPLNRFNIFKLSMIATTGILCVLDIVNWFVFVHHQDQVDPSVDIYTPLLKFSTMLLFFGMTYANIRCGVVSSAILFVFSLLLVLCGAPQFRTELRSYGDVFRGNGSASDWHETMKFLSSVLQYFLTLVIFLANCFADAVSKSLVDGEKPCPGVESSILSRLVFAWFDSLMWKAYRRTLNEDDLPDVNHNLKWANISQNVESKLNLAFKRHEKRRCRRPGRENNGSKNIVSVLRPLFETFWVYIVLGFLLRPVRSIINFANPLILDLFLAFIGDKEAFVWRGYFYAILLFTMTILQTISLSIYVHMTFRTGLRISSVLMSLIYRKTLRVSNRARKEMTSGEVVNLLSVDVDRFADAVQQSAFLCAAPIEIILAAYCLWRILGPSTIAGILTIVLCMLLNYKMASKIHKQQIKLMKRKDERIKLINEILSGIKVLKLNAWEPSFEKEVDRIRRKEIDILRVTSRIQSASSFVSTAAPFLVTLVTFAVYVLSNEENVLTARVAFVSLSLFNVLRFPLYIFPQISAIVSQGIVSLKRINKFLNAEELNPNAVSHEKRPEPVIVENGHFSWDGPEGEQVLSRINFAAKSGSLIAVVGAVGSGKSSFLSAILGDMYKLSGTVNTTGSLAYVPQQAWILNTTLKENITFGGTQSHSFYTKILEACALRADLNTLPGRDQAEIGEKGVNLSGGQKQRVNLARAVYSDADTYLLDDPLSAVDSHVGKHIFEKVIGPNGLLREKTRIWVTHNLSYLSQADLIIILQDGTISQCGSYNDLLDMGGDFANYIGGYLKEDASNSNIERDGIETINEPGEAKENEPAEEMESIPVVGPALIEEEKTAIGKMKWKIYTYYLKSVGLVLLALILSTNLLFQVFSMASNYWLSVWSKDTSVPENGYQNMDKQYMYLGVYALFGFSEAVSVGIQTIAVFAGALKAANSVHKRLLGSVLHWTTFSFDRIPSGRIINRFGSDMDNLDNRLPNNFAQTFTLTASVTSTLFIISYTIPQFVTVVLPIIVLYCVIQRFSLMISRQLKRFESISRSPIYSHVGETIAGVQSIRAHCLQSEFIDKLHNLIDTNQKSSYARIIATRWLTFRLDFIGGMISFFTALFAVFSRDTLTAALVGLAVSYALQLTGKLFAWIQSMSETETNMVSIERIREYDDVQREASWRMPEEKLPNEWPSGGEVVFENVYLRYRSDLEPVLKGIDFRIMPGEKVGIVGRTGAGKSSLVLALFRIIEPAGGRILIDGVDVTKLGLHTLRSRLTIIPQDPILFSGTLRRNLDPTDAHSDESLWRALETANLKAFVSSLKFGLQAEVAEGGSNLSVGQRQLICLARAVLRKTKVLLLDEATAAVDVETDDLIQTTIRKEFEDCTVLTIAHRLNTVLDYNRIMVLDNGRVVEFDSPNTLLKSRQSFFYKLASDAGLI